jgi:hypothetical protein
MQEKPRKRASKNTRSKYKMDDLRKDMRPRKAISPKMRKLLDKEQRAARQRIIERGIVHFRADKQFMESLLDAADRLKIAPGVLCRQIVWRYLQAGAAEPNEPTAESEENLGEALQQLRTRQDQILAEVHAVYECLSPQEKTRKRKRKLG